MREDYTDSELAAMADWAEEKERAEPSMDWKKAYGALRQGADWLLRSRIKQRQHEMDKIDNSIGKAMKQ